MPEPVPPWLHAVPPRFQAPLARTAAGLPANVALMQLLVTCAEPDEAALTLATAGRAATEAGDSAAANRIAAVADLLSATPNAFAIVRDVLDGLDHAHPPGDELAYWAAAFDRAAREHPEAGVALYAFGDPQRLAAVTAEVADRLFEWGLVQAETEALDIGCGIGRFERALAPRIRHITGIDLSAGMIEAARARTADLANVAFRPASGRDLAGFPEAGFDLVLIVDAFPYIVDAGTDLAHAMFREASRVLRPAGHLAIFNYSYRGDRARDVADLRTFAAEAGLELIRDASADFSLWDADTFILRKEA